MGALGDRERDRFDELLRAWERDGAQPFLVVWAGLWSAIRRIPSSDPKRWRRVLAAHGALAGAGIVVLGWLWGIVLVLTPAVTIIFVVFFAVTFTNVYLMVFGPPGD